MSARATLLERAGAQAYLAGWALARRLPERAVTASFARVGDGIWRRRGRGVVQLERNLRRVVGPGPSEEELRRLSRAAMRSYLRYWAETFRLPAWTPELLDARVLAEGVEGEGGLRARLRDGVGVVLALPHSANWDLAGAWVAQTVAPFTTVAERLRPEKLFDAFVAHRESLGMEVLALEPGSAAGRAARAEVFATLSARLRDGRLVCLVADRDLTSSGTEVRFFGETARMPAGPAALAVGTGAALMPVTLWYEPGRMRIRVHQPVPQPTAGSQPERIAEMTRRLAAVFEDAIRQHPADWHMLQRLWTADLRLRHEVPGGPPRPGPSRPGPAREDTAA